MRVTRSINNNEVVDFGKRIGFIHPSQVHPLSWIDCTPCDVVPSQIELPQSTPEDVMSMAADAADLANQLRVSQFLQNLVFTPADHIGFTLQRYEQGIVVKLLLCHMTEQLCPEELAVEKLVLNAIGQKFSIKLTCEAAAAIAIHMVNNEIPSKDAGAFDKAELIERCTKAIGAARRIRPQAPVPWQRTAALTGPRGSLR